VARGKAEAVTRARFYNERGSPVEVITWWAGRGPRNVLIRRADGRLVVRPFRGLRRLRQR
jgi:acetyl esterase